MIGVVGQACGPLLGNHQVFYVNEQQKNDSKTSLVSEMNNFLKSESIIRKIYFYFRSKNCEQYWNQRSHPGNTIANIARVSDVHGRWWGLKERINNSTDSIN